MERDFKELPNWSFAADEVSAAFTAPLAATVQVELSKQLALTRTCSLRGAGRRQLK
jgi:hypothetical protein